RGRLLRDRIKGGSCDQGGGDQRTTKRGTAGSHVGSPVGGNDSRRDPGLRSLFPAGAFSRLAKVHGGCAASPASNHVETRVIRDVHAPVRSASTIPRSPDVTCGR